MWAYIIVCVYILKVRDLGAYVQKERSRVSRGSLERENVTAHAKSAYERTFYTFRINSTTTKGLLFGS